MSIFLSSNLKLLRKNRKFSQEEVSKLLKLTRSSYSGYENGVAEPGLENLIKLSTFYKIPLDDLLKKDLSKLSAVEWESIENGVYVDIKGQKLRVLTASVSQENEEVIEMIPEQARAGYTLGYADPEYIRVLPTFQLPFLKKDRKYRSFPISGDSMPPVSEGSHVIGEYVQNWETIKDGQPCIVVTKDDGIVFKILNRVSNKRDKFQLLSTNPVYAPYIVDVNSIIEIWQFVNYISHDLPEVTFGESDLIQTVKGIQKQVNELSVIIKQD